MSSKYIIAANMEFVRSADKSFAEGVSIAAGLGYKYIEPMVHTGWELLSEVNYFHSFSMEEDPLLMKEICDKHGIRVGSLSGHSPLMKPEAAIPRLTRAIVLASSVGAKFVNTDEMVKPAWMTDEEAHQAMYYTLRKIEMVARRHKVYVCIEPHGIYTKTAAGLLKIVNLVQSPWIRINWDTGNSYLAGIEDPYVGLEMVKDFVYHVHAKDISMEQSASDRGKMTGTPVGCACGQGVVEWERVLDILDPLGREIILSVECGTIQQAKDSLEFLNKLVQKRA
ncbi:MAG: sugar phosphate isomerase/epimerase family protein [Cyclobacteriaceae bacterium]|nr:sugar phosphate isomerase/epimerase family protein [Cyclobacteriaceae bacterium]